MATIAKINREAARNNPETVFDTPRALADAPTLTRAEKITALKRWAFDVRERLDASSEGMVPSSTIREDEGKVEDVTTRDSDLLREIELVLEEIEQGRGSEESA